MRAWYLNHFLIPIPSSFSCCSSSPSSYCSSSSSFYSSSHTHMRLQGSKLQNKTKNETGQHIADLSQPTKQLTTYSNQGPVSCKHHPSRFLLLTKPYAWNYAPLGLLLHILLFPQRAVHLALALHVSHCSFPCSQCSAVMYRIVQCSATQRRPHPATCSLACHVCSRPKKPEAYSSKRSVLHTTVKK